MQLVGNDDGRIGVEVFLNNTAAVGESELEAIEYFVDDVVDVHGVEVSPRAVRILDLYLVADEVPTEATVVKQILCDVVESNFLLVRLFCFLFHN